LGGGFGYLNHVELLCNQGALENYLGRL